MPIIGLTDTVAPRFPRLGKLRKGAPKPEQGNKPGADLDHFRFDGEPDIAAAFTAAYGREPRALPVFLPFASPADCFSAWKEKWSAGGLVHRCDGQTMTIWRTPDGKYSRTPKPCDGGCDEVARLEVILPELFRAGHVGYVTLETHGLNDMLGIQATLNAAYSARQDLRGIEFVLRRVEREISTPGSNGQRARRTKWIVELAPAPRWAQVQLAMAQSAALALPEPAETIDHETGEIVNEPAQLPAPAPAPQIQIRVPDAPKTNGNGHAPKPAGNGDAKRDAVQKRFAQVARDAKAIGVTVEDLPADISTDDLIEKGKALRKSVVARAEFVINRHPQGKINLDDTDDQMIAQAVRLYATFQEPANVPA